LSQNDFGSFFDFLGEKICELRILFPDGVKQFFVTNRGDFAEICQRYNGKAQIYVSVNERDGKGGNKENVTSLTNVFVDLDANRPNKKEWGATEKELKHAEAVANKILTWYEEQGFHRPLIILSGNGYQLLSGTPKVELTKENRDEIELKVKAFNELIRNKFQTPLIDIDSVWDLPRVVGVPFTWNRKKYVSDERPARIRMPEDHKIPARFEDQKLLDFILSLEVKRKESAPVEPVEYEDQKILRIISELCPARKELWEKGTEKGQRSHALHYLCCHFAAKGLSKSQICHLLWDLDTRTDMSKFVDRPEMYEYDYEKTREEWPDFGKKDVTCEKMQEHGFCREEHQAICPPILRELYKEKAIELGKDPVKFLRHLHQCLEYRLTGEWKNRLFMFLVAVGANVKTVLIRIFGANAAGKKMLYYWLSEFFGEENVIVMSSQTAAWLKRKVLQGLDTKGKIFVLIEERADPQSQAKYAFEQIYSEDKIKIGFNVRGEGGDWEAIEVELQGPLCFITTSTELEESLHAKTREWEVNPDESMEQTRRIDAWFNWRELLPLSRIKEEKKEIELIKAYIYTLKQYNEYRIPFINKIKWPYKTLEDRRKKQDFCNLIRFGCHLFQHILPRDEEKSVVFALPFLYDIVRAIADEIIMVSRGALTKSEKRLLDFVQQHYPVLLSVTLEGKKPKKYKKWGEELEEDAEAFTVSDVVNHPEFEAVFGDIGHNAVRTKLDGLANKKWIRKEGLGKGKPALYYMPQKGAFSEKAGFTSLIPELEPISISDIEVQIQRILKDPNFSLHEMENFVHLRIKPEDFLFQPEWHEEHAFLEKATFTSTSLKKEINSPSSGRKITLTEVKNNVEKRSEI